MKIGKRYTFEAAHHLPGHKGKCANPHGHSYVLEVEIEGGLIDDEGASDDHMVEDFATLDVLVEEVVDLLDHHDLNQLGFFKRTTAESIVLWIAGTLLKAMMPAPMYQERHRVFGGDTKLSRVRLYETAKAYAEWTG